MSADLNTPLLRSSAEFHINDDRPQPNPKSGSLFQWVITALGAGGVAIPQGYLAVTSLIAKSTVSGVVFGAGALICTGTCAYSIYRAANPIQFQIIEQIVPAADTAAAKANIQMLRQINSRLNGMLSEDPDLEAGIDDAHLHTSIDEKLREIEQMLPQMRTELEELRKTVAAMLESRSVSSPSGAGSASPAVDNSAERDLLRRLDRLANRVAKDASSRSSSRFSSTTASPAGLNRSRLTEGSPAASPVERTARKISFGPDTTIPAPDDGTE